MTKSSAPDRLPTHQGLVLRRLLEGVGLRERAHCGSLTASGERAGPPAVLLLVVSDDAGPVIGVHRLLQHRGRGVVTFSLRRLTWECDALSWGFRENGKRNSTPRGATDLGMGCAAPNAVSVCDDEEWSWWSVMVHHFGLWHCTFLFRELARLLSTKPNARQS